MDLHGQEPHGCLHIKIQVKEFQVEDLHHHHHDIQLYQASQSVILDLLSAGEEECELCCQHDQGGVEEEGPVHLHPHQGP
jgi:hypothetical protein